MTNNLRKKVRLFKAETGINYKTIAERLGITQSSLYNWLRGDYEFSADREMRLLDLIEKGGTQNDGNT